MKNSFKEMVHNPNSRNSDDSDCCRECMNYYCATKQECDWMKREKWLHENCTVFFPRLASIVDATSALSILKNVRNLRTGKEESHSEREYRLLITILFAIYLLFCIALYVGRP